MSIASKSPKRAILWKSKPVERDMPKRAKAPKGFYTASEVMKMLGIPSSTLYDLVKAGKIERVVEPPRKDGYYPRAPVDEMVRAKQLFLIQYSTDTAIFTKAT